MNAVKASNLYTRMSSILESYLGPAAERFLERQIKFHLDKKPNEVTENDIPELTEWIKISMALLTEDRAVIDECEQKLLSLEH